MAKFAKILIAACRIEVSQAVIQLKGHQVQNWLIKKKMVGFSLVEVVCKVMAMYSQNYCLTICKIFFFLIFGDN